MHRPQKTTAVPKGSGGHFFIKILFPSRLSQESLEIVNMPLFGMDKALGKLFRAVRSIAAFADILCQIYDPHCCSVYHYLCNMLG